MYDYYCKNCNYQIGNLYYYYYYYDGGNKYYNISTYCYRIESKNINSLYFLNCYKCNKFVGIKCKNVCENCFGKNEIFGEKNIFNWFLKYKKIKSQNLKGRFICKVCNKINTRCQHWFFKELTFYK